MNFLFLLIIINSILVGVILMTQILSYPLLLKLSKSDFYDYYNSYTKRISFIVIPLMIFEVLLSIILNTILNNFYLFASNILLLVIWGSTFFIQVPIHNKLSSNHSYSLINKLIFTNWIRTIAWISKLMTLIKLKAIL
ncbi:MAG: hypothetical protein CMG26_05765 [Candidatus Marinimicrobia bacterium]|nr:hypothetical protein [Candidatus Neomarinimicrobiota bacterium]MBV67843.1 hypothetical protein [Candidatus Neomarinimicrobiota bacterium]|tara:strand:+ start:2098 stop:2511 length:414 start_codon:yes stop_codon:yes gene_type:complete